MPEEILENPGCLTLPEEFVDEMDFKAEEAIKIDENIVLPESFSLGKWIWETNYQGAIGSCTANSTSHGVQVLSVAKNGEVPTNRNIITPDWRDLWSKMGHDPKKYDGGDYVEKAVNTALKLGVMIEENGDIATFDAYCTLSWDGKDKTITMMKRYLYNLNPIVWCMRGDKSVRNQLSAGQLKTGVPSEKRSGGHAICLVGWDKTGFRFVNSWKKNDGLQPAHKSRFHVPYDVLKKRWDMFNFRMWILYAKIDALKSPEYLKRKSRALVLLKALRKMYDEEGKKVKKEIVDLSLSLREEYPELNDEYPVE